jgi:hypothetical protein
MVASIDTENATDLRDAATNCGHAGALTRDLTAKASAALT